MASWHRFACSGIFCVLLIVIPSYAYEKIYLEDYCASDERVSLNLGSASSNSSGILELSRGRGFLPDRNCSVFLQPPLGFGVVLSVRYLNFRPFYIPDCRNYVEVLDKSEPIRLCGYSDDVTEYQSYSSEEGPLRLNLVTGAEINGTTQYSDIGFVVTSYVKLGYTCEASLFQCQNSRCVWAGLTCDGHNNCGDQSDEFSSTGPNCGMMSSGVVAGIVVAAVLTFVLLIVATVACCKISKRRRARNCQEDTPVLIRPDTDYNTASPSSGSIQRTDSGSGATSGYGGYQEAPPAYKP